MTPFPIYSQWLSQCCRWNTGRRIELHVKGKWNRAELVSLVDLCKFGWSLLLLINTRKDGVGITFKISCKSSAGANDGPTTGEECFSIYNDFFRLEKFSASPRHFLTMFRPNQQNKSCKDPVTGDWLGATTIMRIYKQRTVRSQIMQDKQRRSRWRANTTHYSLLSTTHYYSLLNTDIIHDYIICYIW